ncbi:TFIID-31kDa-domain-containing protein [Sistotremastrum niveocremeum HHB9708]|uniref:TFIID-31kDa-domain-containing protein n=1 Tax=Sistotremastrum niveocremeum HHB9708 TaxID=1314777 RepID=A0A164ZE45_9AGAM|nr:TFIID-31kDa-domain-containing protein [Sistotremastrum niveocremeum HHB9708]
MPPDTLPATARSIALLLAANPAVNDSQPGVLHQLLEFSHRYTTQVLTDALVYAEHAGRAGKIEVDDITLAIQAKVGWEMGGRVPKEFILSLASQTNAIPLPAVPEVFGVRLPAQKDRLTAVDFDIVPTHPPPGVQLYEEEVEEEIEEEGGDADEDEDDEMEEMDVSAPANANPPKSPSEGDSPVPDDDMDGADEDDNLFADEDKDEDGAEAGEPASTDAAQTNGGVKRKLMEDDDYD